MSSFEKTIWPVCTVVLFAVSATCLGLFMWCRDGSGQEANESFKIEVDAATRATPRRLAAPLEITNISTYEALNFDRAIQDSGIISYELSKPAWVRIRLVARRDRNLVLRTLVDWSKKDLGKNSERWDGRDSSGNLLDREKCPCYFIIEGDSAEHAAHERNKCGDMTLHLIQPKPDAVVAGALPLRVALAGHKRGYIEEDSGVMRTYVNYELVCEQPFKAGEVSFDRQWDTTTVPNGSHIVTVNIDDGRDHVATASVTVTVDN